MTILLLVLLCITSAQGMRCPSGTFQTSKNSCEICPPGTWRQSLDPFRPPDAPCIPCMAGFFSPIAGAVGEDLCRPCPSNTFSGSPGSTSCKPCPPGTSSNSGASQCLRCGPGSAVSRDSKRCVTCRRGFYSTEPTNNKCTLCPLPKTSSPGATSESLCRFCPPGESAFRGPCEPCRHGDFKPNRKGFCERCPAGAFSNDSGATECKLCPPGTFRNRFTRRGRACKPCKPGSTSVGSGNPVCRFDGEPCKKKFFEDSNGDCRTCESGYRLNLAKMKCEKCPAGMVSPGGVQTICVRCTDEQIPNRLNTFCGCALGTFPGRQGGCKPCPVGQYNPNLFGSIFEGTSCISCDPGTFSDTPGAIICKKCPPGEVSLRGAAKCVPCPKDTYMRGCRSERTNCPVGFNRTFVGANFKFFGCKRVTCTLDTNKEDIGKTCAPCNPGSFFDTEKKRCRQCPSDEVSSGGLVTSCKKCPNGLVQDTFDPSKCVCKRSNARGKGLQDGVCRRCPRGSVGKFDSDFCVPCPPGTFSDRERIFCPKCPIDTFSKEGASRCTKCPEGTISDRRPGGINCIPIPV